MKKFMLFIFGYMALLGCIKAEPLRTPSPIKEAGIPVSLAISSTTLTKLPSSQTSGRVGVYISNPSTSVVAGFLGDCNSTSLASTIRPFELGRTTAALGDSSMLYLELREDVCLWLISLDTSFASRTVHYQEVKK